MMEIGIVTKIDNNNYGNRLQNYAMQVGLKKITKTANVITLKNYRTLNVSTNRLDNFLRRIKFNIKKIEKNKYENRLKNFLKFNEYINLSLNVYDDFHTFKKIKLDAIVLGSDQIWNYKFDMPRLYFGIGIPADVIISVSASFGVSSIPNSMKNLYKKNLRNIKYISVREDDGKKIVEELTGRKDVEVLVDPTMLLSAEEWDKVSKKPTMLKTDKYILNYFLGNLSEERKNEINRIAKENNCEVINVLDRESPFYECGPSEFLYLEKNAFLICTDSFHSSVFGILYNTPFLVFEREDNTVSMNSRLDTLLSKFKLDDRRYKGKIAKKDLKCDYTEAYQILDKERIKSMNFLKKALDIKDSDKNE